MIILNSSLPPTPSPLLSSHSMVNGGKVIETKREASFVSSSASPSKRPAKKLTSSPAPAPASASATTVVASKPTKDKPAGVPDVNLLPPELPSLIPEASACIHPSVLFCWDLDGTIVYRQSSAKDPSAEYKGGGSDSRVAVGSTPFKLCTLPKGNAKVYLRPHAFELLRWLMLDPNANGIAPLAFYTSMTQPNAFPLCQQLVLQSIYGEHHGEKKVTLPRQLEFEGWREAKCAAFELTLDAELVPTPSVRSIRYMVFPREYNTHDPTGANPWDTMRDLSRIWASPLNNSAISPCTPSSAVSQSSPHRFLFGNHNTILIDNEPRKTRNFQSNAINVSTWERPEMSAYDMILDNHLLGVRQLLAKLLNAKQQHQTQSSVFDVRQWIPTNAPTIRSAH